MKTNVSEETWHRYMKTFLVVRLLKVTTESFRHSSSPQSGTQLLQKNPAAHQSCHKICRIINNCSSTQSLRLQNATLHALHALRACLSRRRPSIFLCLPAGHFRNRKSHSLSTTDDSDMSRTQLSPRSAPEQSSVYIETLLKLRSTHISIVAGLTRRPDTAECYLEFIDGRLFLRALPLVER